MGLPPPSGEEGPGCLEPSCRKRIENLLRELQRAWGTERSPLQRPRKSILEGASCPEF